MLKLPSCIVRATMQEGIKARAGHSVGDACESHASRMAAYRPHGVPWRGCRSCRGPRQKRRRKGG